MPGFIIRGSENNQTNLWPEPLPGDWLRNHRFLVTEFFGLATQSNNPELMAVKDVRMPDKMIRSIEIQTPGTTHKFSKSASYSDLVINFYGSYMLLYDLNILHDRAHNLENGIGDFEQYMGIVKMRLYASPDRRLYTEYIYKNAWVSDISHTQLTYGSSDIKDIGVTIKFGFFEVVDSWGDIVLSDYQGFWRGNG